jgi:hypothetical protein
VIDIEADHVPICVQIDVEAFNDLAVSVPGVLFSSI